MHTRIRRLNIGVASLEMLDNEIINITILSFKVSGSAVLASSMIGVPLGTLLALFDFKGKRVVTTLIHTFMGLPPVVVGLMLYLLLSRSGYLGPLELLYTPAAMIIAQFILALPVVIGLSYSAVASIPSRLVEHTVSLGATRAQLMRIMVEEARVGVISSIIAAFGGAVSEVGAIMIVGGNIRYFTRTLTTAIVFYTEMGEFEKAIALGVILLSSSFLINLLLTCLQNKRSTGNRGNVVPHQVKR